MIEKIEVGDKKIEEPISGPIMACVGSRSSYPIEDQIKLADIRRAGEVVNYHGIVEHWKSNNQRNGEIEASYVISSINSSNKFSEGYHNCTGIVAVGLSKDSNENLSILTHQDPHFILASSERSNKFLSDVRDSLEELKNKTRPGSVDVILFGGDYKKHIASIVNERADSRKTRNDDYVEAVEEISAVIREVFGLEPKIVAGPKIASVIQVDVCLDTQKRRLYLYRPQNRPGADRDFAASEVRKHIEGL